MNKVPVFDEGSVESLAKLLGDCGSGSDISRVLSNLDMDDQSEGYTKWRRLYRLFLDLQEHDRCANRVLAFIRSFLTPTRFVGRDDEFEQHRTTLNTVLAFSGLEYGADGKFQTRPAAATLAEADRRARTIQSKFQGRRIHPGVLKYCKAELMQDNYFHAVFEASKGLAQRIRDKAGVDGDGARLVDRVFSVEQPILALNTLRTETERTEHKGFTSLLKGCFAAVRNPLAHEPKIMWDGEDDAADYFTLLSLLNRKLDDCIPTRIRGSQVISELHSYPVYRPSGALRLGDVPTHWEIRRLRTVAEMRVSNVDKHTREGEFPVRLCNYVDVYKNDIIAQAMLFMSATASQDEIERFPA